MQFYYSIPGDIAFFVGHVICPHRRDCRFVMIGAFFSKVFTTKKEYILNVRKWAYKLFAQGAV